MLALQTSEPDQTDDNIRTQALEAVFDDVLAFHVRPSGVTKSGTATEEASRLMQKLFRGVTASNCVFIAAAQWLQDTGPWQGMNSPAVCAVEDEEEAPYGLIMVPRQRWNSSTAYGLPQMLKVFPDGRYEAVPIPGVDAENVAMTAAIAAELGRTDRDQDVRPQKGKKASGGRGRGAVAQQKQQRGTGRGQQAATPIDTTVMD